MSLFLSFSNDELDIEFGKLAGQMHLRLSKNNISLVFCFRIRLLPSHSLSMPKGGTRELFPSLWLVRFGLEKSSRSSLIWHPTNIILNPANLHQMVNYWERAKSNRKLSFHLRMDPGKGGRFKIILCLAFVLFWKPIFLLVLYSWIQKVQYQTQISLNFNLTLSKWKGAILIIAMDWRV